MKKILTHASFFILSVAVLVIIACTGESRAKEKPRYTYKEAGQPGSMVTIDGKTYSDDDLMGDEKLEFAELYRKLHDLRVERVGQLLFQKAYEDAAKAAGLSLDDYIETKVLKGEPKISDKEYNAFVKEKNIPKEQQTTLKDRILAYLKAQKRFEERSKLLVQLAKKHNVALHFNKPEIKVHVDIGNAPLLGNKEARVKIIEFSDFQCPYCSQAATTVNQLKKHYGKKILVAYKHFPLPMHPQAKPAAEASMCVHEQNQDKYWKYHDKLFANQNKLDSDSLKKYAKEVGIKTEQFEECFSSKKYSKLIQDDLDYGSRLGVRSTPTFFINGRLVSGALPLEQFKEIIEEELSSSGS